MVGALHNMVPTKITLFDADDTAFTIAAGQVIFKDGDPADRMFAVVEGKVDIMVKGHLVETVEAGGVFGEMSLIEEKPRNATATVSTDAKLVNIDRKRFLFLVQQNPYFAIQLMQIMAGRLAGWTSGCNMPRRSGPRGPRARSRSSSL
jgi:CRP/FNR family transcriptional regulator, cyclic AMP receptor protein